MLTPQQKRAISTKICEPLSEMTDRNDHTEAGVFLAERLNEARTSDQSRELLAMAESILVAHDKIGWMPKALMNFRDNVRREAIEAYSAIWGDNAEQVRVMINASF